VKLYRDDGRAETYLVRDEGSPVVIVPDHGEVTFRWRPIVPEMLRYDSAAGVAVPADQLAVIREKLISGVIESKTTGPIKADLRALIEDVVK
jgi:hypothetical protein